MAITYYREETTAVMDDIDVLDSLFNDHSCGDSEEDEFELDIDVDEVEIA